MYAKHLTSFDQIMSNVWHNLTYMFDMI